MVMFICVFSANKVHADWGPLGPWPGGDATYTYTGFSSPDFATHVNLAANAWTTKTDFEFTLASSSTNAEVYVDELFVSNVDWAGLCSNYADKETANYISSSYIIINSYYTNTYDYATTRYVICHELGHAIGLNHRPNIYNTIMGPSVAAYMNSDGTVIFWEPQSLDIEDVNDEYL